VSSETSRTGGREIAAAVGMFALGFVVIAGLIHAGIRDAFHLHADFRSEKLLLLDRWSGKAFTASFGSSHMHEGFDPRSFDRIMAGGPDETKTVNLAIAGGSQTEQRLTALEFLKHLQAPPADDGTSGPKACMVILELAAGANFGSEFLVHPRTINIYNWDTTRFVMRLAPPQMPRSQRAGRVGFALLAMGMNSINMGMLSSMIFPAPLDTVRMDAETRDDRRGLLSLENHASDQQRLKKFVDDSPKQPTMVQGMILAGNRELVDELEAASPVRNLEVVYTVLPKLSDLSEETQYPDLIETQHGPTPILNLARPDLYPQFYQPKMWVDEAHLNAQGADLVTKQLAENLKTWNAAHGEPGRCER
jgi:hypothetical protein